jgi:hypothetical protein
MALIVYGEGCLSADGYSDLRNMSLTKAAIIRKAWDRL